MKKRLLALLLCGVLAFVLVAGAIWILGRALVSPPHIPCEAIRPLITYHGITYTPATAMESSHQLTEADLGAVIGTAGTGPHDVQYDCALLSPDQQVYRIIGYRDTFRLAARGQNGIFFFEVADNPSAKMGADLFDINGKVQFITVAPFGNPGSPSKTVRDPQSIQVLTKIILAAPVARQCSYGQDEEVFLFHLKDGNVVEADYGPTSQELGTGWPQCVTLPQRFAALLAASH